MKQQSKIIKMNKARHMVITPPFRVSFPNVFVPRSFQDTDGVAKNYSLDMIFNSEKDFDKEHKGKTTQTPSMKRVLFNAKVDQWGSKDKWPKFPFPVFKEGNERQNKDGEILNGYEDKFYATAKCGEKFPPKVVGLDGKPLDEKSFYPGCYAIAGLMARPYIFGKNQGVRFILLQIQKVKDGERFGGTPDDLFDVSEVSEDSLESDGDIGFDGQDDF